MNHQTHPFVTIIQKEMIVKVYKQFSYFQLKKKSEWKLASFQSVIPEKISEEIKFELWFLLYGLWKTKSEKIGMKFCFPICYFWRNDNWSLFFV